MAAEAPIRAAAPVRRPAVSNASSSLLLLGHRPILAPSSPAPPRWPDPLSVSATVSQPQFGIPFGFFRFRRLLILSHFFFACFRIVPVRVHLSFTALLRPTGLRVPGPRPTLAARPAPASPSASAYRTPSPPTATAPSTSPPRSPSARCRPRPPPSAPSHTPPSRLLWVFNNKSTTIWSEVCWQGCKPPRYILIFSKSAKKRQTAGDTCWHLQNDKGAGINMLVSHL